MSDMRERHVALGVEIAPSHGAALGDKRQGVPFVIRFTCPNCGSRQEHDYADGGYYFMYPEIPGIQETGLGCDECGEYHGSIKVRLGMTMTLVVDDGDDT